MIYSVISVLHLVVGNCWPRKQLFDATPAIKTFRFFAERDLDLMLFFPPT